MKIRFATPHEADDLAKVYIDSWRSAYKGLVPESHLGKLDYTKSAEQFSKALEDSSEETYIAEEESEVIGFLTVGACRDDDVDNQRTGEIWGIYLAPTHWRRGVGSSLCQYGERLLQSRGYTVASLWVFKANEQAGCFYEAMGFTPDGASKMLHPGAPLEAVRYRKKLRDAEPVTSVD